MRYEDVIESLVINSGGRIIYLVLDGVGGIQGPSGKGTALQQAHAPELDRLAADSSCGLLDIVGPAITPGSGPGHLALFGYDPLKYDIGRGVFSALGIGFELQQGDIAARINFATIDSEGKVTDRRAGRIDSDLNRELCETLRQKLHIDGVQLFLETVSEHRAVLILRGNDLGGHVEDTDPQRTGEAPLNPQGRDEQSSRTANVYAAIVEQVRTVLSDRTTANMILLRGVESYQPIPTLQERFALRGLCVADYPMYRGVARYIGMDVTPPPGGMAAQIQMIKKHWDDEYDLFFLHLKATDKAGEDGDFARKVTAIEAIDDLIPQLRELGADVFVVTGDHSTPAAMQCHSWHSVPVLLHAKNARVDSVKHFDELACGAGSLGWRKGKELLPLALAHAGRLRKYGA